MKRLLVSLGFCMAILGLCSCEKENIPSKNEPISKNNCTLEHQFEGEFSCPQMKNIKQNGSRFFITNDGQLYEYSYKIFSTTDNNCQKVNTDVVFDKVIRNTLVSKQGDFYSYTESNLKKITNEEIEKGRAWYGLSQMEIRLYKKNNNIFYLAILDHNDPDIYGYVEGNNVYSITYDYNNDKANEKLIHTFEKNEVIENVTNGYVITNKGYYVYDIINKTKCEKYEDIKCEYGLVKIENKSACTGEVIYISHDLLVDKDMIK